jgi:hypothetical protein
MKAPERDTLCRRGDRGLLARGIADFRLPIADWQHRFLGGIACRVQLKSGPANDPAPVPRRLVKALLRPNSRAPKGHYEVAGGNAPGTVSRKQADPERVA